MRKIVLLAHISLDGFAAGINGELDGFSSGDENLGFVCDLTDRADTALFGRVSYQLLDTHWPGVKEQQDATENEKKYSNWYNTAQKIVISKTLIESGPGITIIANNVIEEIAAIKQQPGKDILVFGSPSVSQLLMRYGLIDVYFIFINPVLFAKGIPLFAGVENRSKLQLVATHRFPNGEIALKYISEL